MSLRPTTAKPSWLRLLLIASIVGCLGGPAGAQVSGQIAVYPQTSSLEATSTRQFSAYVPISPNTIVWLVNGVPGGNAMLGTITSKGYYKPPAVIPAANVLTISAQSTVYPKSVGHASLRLTRPYPWLWSVSPGSVAVGPYSVSFNGSNFAPDSQALANGAPVTTRFVSPTKLVATSTAVEAGTLRFAVRQPGTGEVTGNVVNAKVTAAVVKVTVSPSSANLVLGNSLTLSASVSGTSDAAVTWSVNGVAGGTATFGTVSAAGVYTAPATLPPAAAISIRATSVASPSAHAQAAVTLAAPPPPVAVALSPQTASVPLGATQTFSATVSGSGSNGVTWSVNGASGGSSTVGTITPAGIYTAPTAMPPGNAVTVRATSTVNPSAYAQASVQLTAAPPVQTTSLAAARFLEQSSFGPTPATLARVEQIGIDAYLDEQFGMPETQIPAPPNNSVGSLRQWMLHNYSASPDQLRQRVAYALSQIIVTSGNKLVYANEMLLWLRLLSQHAFGSYRELLRDVSMSASMGKFLDLANSNKPGAMGGANENYPRELMQLFTIGLWELNQDGSPVTGTGGTARPAYGQADVQQVALALTGWTYATAPGATARANNWEYFGAPMETRPANHATGPKNFLTCSLAAGQSVQQDLDAVIDCLMAHPNIAPFIATRLIRSLVTSNPSPAYVARVADVFAGRHGGAVGDLKATVRAILLDQEARQSTATATQGRLKEPILQASGLLRALNGQFASANQITYLFEHMGQAILTPPSVFSWFSPLYRVPGSTLFGPEFQIYSPTEATLRGNFLYSLLTNPGGDAHFDLSPFLPYGNDMARLVEAVNQVLLYGRMPTAMKQTLIAAAAPGYDANTRIVTVLYLTALSGPYAVQH